MSEKKYLTSPPETTALPKGIPYIIGNEFAERFSFYGMRGILVIFMTKYLVDREGQLAVMSEDEAVEWFHDFVFWAYATPVLGAFLSDVFLGKYRTIILLSIVYCLGHLALALDETQLGLFLGLTLISIGAGGIKPCVSAHVGDQFGVANQQRISTVFGWFYFSINLGAALSSIVTPLLLDRVGPWLAFGVPGLLMFLATLAFWFGRHTFVHVPAGGIEFLKETFSTEGLKALGKLSILYVFVTMFWSLFDQSSSKWVLQADQMDREIFGITLLPSQIQAANPILILILIPMFSYVIYPAINRVFKLNPIRKIAIGLFLAAVSFTIPAFVELAIQSGSKPHIGWQALAYIVLTAAEVMVSITFLEFSYTQAPRKMKSVIMSLFFLSVAAGNKFTSMVNKFIQNDDGTSKLEGADYYWFFTAAMLGAAVLFSIVGKFYREKTYIQE
jgi:POT family proton-dependent oligopeptide transporter